MFGGNLWKPGLKTVMDFRGQVLKTGVDNGVFRSEISSGFEESGGTPPPPPPPPPPRYLRSAIPPGSGVNSKNVFI